MGTGRWFGRKSVVIGAVALAALAITWMVLASGVRSEEGEAADVVAGAATPSTDPAPSGATEPERSPAAEPSPSPSPGAATRDAAPESPQPADSGASVNSPAGSNWTGGFGEGTVAVASDVAPGLYMAVVPADSGGCVWERLANIDARVEETLAADNANPGARVVVELMEADEAFRSNGCGEWVPYSAPAAPATSMGQGTWLVGQDIAAGRYRSAGPVPEGVECVWERQLGFSGAFYDILESATTSTQTTVEVAPSDFSFKSIGCAEWQRVG